MDDVEEEFQLFQSTSWDDGTIPKRADEAQREMDLTATGGGKLFSKPFYCHAWCPCYIILQ